MSLEYLVGSKSKEMQKKGKKIRACHRDPGTTLKSSPDSQH